MRKIELIFCADYGGDWGLMLKGHQHKMLNSSMEGRLIAHDVIEHVSGIGSVAEEIQALGAMYYVRGLEFHYDLQYILEDESIEIEPDPAAEPITTHLMDDIFPDLVTLAELHERHDTNRILTLLYMGYDKAEQLYPIQAEALDMFTNIEKAVSDLRLHYWDHREVDVNLMFDENIAIIETEYEHG